MAIVPCQIAISHLCSIDETLRNKDNRCTMNYVNTQFLHHVLLCLTYICIYLYCFGFLIDNMSCSEQFVLRKQCYTLWKEPALPIILGNRSAIHGEDVNQRTHGHAAFFGRESLLMIVPHKIVVYRPKYQKRKSYLQRSDPVTCRTEYCVNC